MDITATAQQAASVGKSATSLANLSENFDNFLKILTTQMQHQDPLSPMETTEFTQQLVQFAGVEQQVLQNSNLEELLSLQRSNQAIGAVSYMDKFVEAAGSQNMLADGSATFSYVLPETAAAAAIEIRAANGDVVFQQAVETEAGIHDFVWDGTTSRGETAPEGVYSFLVTAVNGEDQPIEAEHRVVGKVTAIVFENGQTTLGIGDVGVPLSAVKGIHATRPASAEAS